MSCDSIYIGEKEIKYSDIDAYAFKFDIDDGDVVFSKVGKTHGSINFDGFLEGRIWVERKIISFWDYNFSDIKIEKDSDDNNLMDGDVSKSNNSRFTFEETLEIIQSNFEGDVDFVDGWRIDVPAEWSEYNTTTYEVYHNDFSLIPIEEFEKIEIKNGVDLDNAKRIHLMNAKEKEAYYKKHGKPKGFGSDKTSFTSKNPIAWRQAKMRSEKRNLKFIKTYKIFEKRN